MCEECDKIPWSATPRYYVVDSGENHEYCQIGCCGEYATDQGRYFGHRLVKEHSYEGEQWEYYPLPEEREGSSLEEALEYFQKYDGFPKGNLVREPLFHDHVYYEVVSQ